MDYRRFIQRKGYKDRRVHKIKHFACGRDFHMKNITRFLGLNFGPQWMRNPPQQEPFPQRTFPLAQYRYGREEMLAIFEQIGSV